MVVERLARRGIITQHRSPVLGSWNHSQVSVCPATPCPEVFTKILLMDFHDIAQKDGVQGSPDTPFFRFFIFVKMAAWCLFLVLFLRMSGKVGVYGTVKKNQFR